MHPSLGLNARLKAENSTTTVVAFIIMPAPNHSYTVDSLKGQAVAKQLRETCVEIQDRIGKRVYESASRFVAVHTSLLRSLTIGL
jgi:glycogen synthase